MRNLKQLIMSGLAVAFVIGLGSIQAKEWEQTFTVDLGMHGNVGTYFGAPKWGFSKDSLVEGYSDQFSYWAVNQYCICSVHSESCNHTLNNYSFFDYDQDVWYVSLKDGLKEGVTLDLNDSSVFEKKSSRDGHVLSDGPYIFENKDNAQADTNYFVYRKDSTYYALCQYITVYDSVTSSFNESYQGGIPAYYVHQCIYQNDGTPTFSKIPMYSGVLPEAKPIRWSGVSKPIGRTAPLTKNMKSYLVNGRTAKGKSAMGIRVGKERVYRQ